MKLESTHKFPEKTYWLFTFKGEKGLSSCVYEPVYDDGMNTITGKRVATDGLDLDGEYEIKIDLFDVRSCERIGPEKLVFINAINADNCALQRIVSACNLKQQLEVGKKIGVVHQNAKQTSAIDTGESEEQSQEPSKLEIVPDVEEQPKEEQSKDPKKISAPGT